MVARPSPVPASPPEDRASGVEVHWVGQTLRGTYRILQVLDQGGMGSVFVAEHVRLRRQVAVKVLAQHLASNSHALGRFQSEAEIISQLQHPNIVHVLDFDATDDGSPYLVMELLQGESLLARLERETTLPIDDVTRIVSQGGSALAAAHRAGIVHRDLKPGNMFLVRLSDQPIFVKLLDFGISKRVGAARGLTGEFDILGTPEYMTPEQALGKTALVDHRGDQYSLAVIAYEALCGAPPFSGSSVMEILQKVIGETPVRLSARAPHVPQEVDAVLERALAKNPNDRYPTIAEFASAFAMACGYSSLKPAGTSLPAARSKSIDPLGATGDIMITQRNSGKLTPRLGDSQTRPRSGQPQSADTNPASEVQTAVMDARTAFGKGDLDLATDLAETALTIAEATRNTDAKSHVERAATLFNRIFLARLGELGRTLVICRMPSSESRVSPEQAFILSRLDGATTIDELLDVSPMPRQQTLRLLVRLLRSEMIDIE